MNFKIHDILSLMINGTNKKHLKYIGQDYSYFRTDESVDADIDVIISDFAPINHDHHIVNHKYLIKNNYIFCKDTHKIVRWKLGLKDIEKKKTTVYFSGSRFSEVFLRDLILEPLIALKLARKGFSLLHASGIALNNKAFLFPACKGTGKTTTILKLAGKGNFLSNEKSILSNDGIIYAFPTFAHIFSYNLTNVPNIVEALTFKQKNEIRIKHFINLLSLGYVSLPLDLNPLQLWDEIGGFYPLESLILLTKTNRDHINIMEHNDKEMLIKKLVVTNKYEMRYLDDLLTAYSYIYPESDCDMEGYWQTFRNNLSKALRNKSCYEIEIPKNYTHKAFDQIWHLLNQILEEKE